MTEIPLERSTGLPTEGMHLFKITKGEEKAAASSGQPQWVLTCICQDAGEDQGKQVTQFLSLSVAARFKIDEMLDAIQAPKKGTWKVDQFVGKMFKATVKYGDYEGRVTVNLLKPAPAGEIKPPAPVQFEGQKSATLPDEAAPASKPIF